MPLLNRGVAWAVARGVWLSLVLSPCSAVAQSPRTIPFAFYGNEIWLEARVADSRPLHFLLSAGASACGLNRSVADELKLRIRTEVDWAGTGNKPVHVSLLSRAKIEVGGVSLGQFECYAMALDDVARDIGGAVDGVIGYELLHRYIVRIDYDSQRLTLYAPKDFRYTGVGSVLPMKLPKQVPTVKLRFGMPGLGALEGTFLVDTGGGSMAFATPFIRKHGLLDAARALTPRLIPGTEEGIGGSVDGEVGRLEWVEIAGHRLKLPLAAYMHADGGVFAWTSIAGTVGGELLRRFSVTLDYPHGRIILEPGRQLEDAFESDASGMDLTSYGPTYRQFIVKRVVDDTPAAEVGIRGADQILEFDGQRAEALTLWDLRRALEKAEVDHVIKLQRGQTEITVKLRTRKLI